MEADREIGERRNGNIDGIAERHRAGRNGVPSLPPKVSLRLVACDDRRTLVAQRNRRGANGEWTIAIGV